MRNMADIAYLRAVFSFNVIYFCTIKSVLRERGVTREVNVHFDSNYQCLQIRNVHTELTQTSFFSIWCMCKIKYLCHDKTRIRIINRFGGGNFPHYFQRSGRLLWSTPPSPHLPHLCYNTIFCIKRINCLIRPTTIIYVCVT